MEQTIRNEIEKILDWEDDIATDANLFEYGLHSLAIMRMVLILSELGNKKLTYVDLASKPTIKDWANMIKAN